MACEPPRFVDQNGGWYLDMTDELPSNTPSLYVNEQSPPRLEAGPTHFVVGQLGPDTSMRDVATYLVEHGMGLSGTLCKWRDLRVRDRVSWAGEDHGHDEAIDDGRDWAGAFGSKFAG
jgi:hypothetical protein